MLRFVALLLVLANAGYYAWNEGLLAGAGGAGFAPPVQAEPQRLTQQIHPEAMKLLTPEDARQVESGSATSGSSPRIGGRETAPGECLQAGLFTDDQANALRNRLSAGFANHSWSLDSVVEPARWIIYMGRYANDDAVVKKRAELRQRGVSFEPLNNPGLEPGLSLGAFTAQSEAETALARIAMQGVRTARVLQERQEIRGQRLRLPSVDAALRTQLDGLKPQLAGKALQACR
ncbi:MAG: SPOR domain-containing protein [Comamonadaceae bacterium]|nr:MAG: SPOR domain-containing protein [Comamonadaceae bacterium]